MKRIVGDNERRFWSYVDSVDDCWIWGGVKNDLGYGRMYLNGKKAYAHRYSYELHVGDIPEGLHLDHLCKEPRCVNPNHLEPVTNRENGLRGNRVTEKASGLPLGVSTKRDKFRSSAMVNGVKKYLGTFCTVEEAKAAYDRVWSS